MKHYHAIFKKISEATEVEFPEKILDAVDEVRKRIGLKRSTFLQKAAEEYLLEHG